MTDCALLGDSRAINTISWQCSIDGPGYQHVGEHGVKSIEVESVAANGAYVPWFIVRTETGYARYNSAYLNYVGYSEETP